MSLMPAEQPSQPESTEQPRLAVPLRLDTGTELLGQYESSAFTQPQYLVRRSDGQIVQVGQLAYTLATCINGERDGAAIASEMSAQLGRPVSVDNVAYLAERKLLPLGILALEGVTAPLTRVNPLLALRFRARIVPERIHRGATWALQPLFRAPVVAAVLAALIGVNVWVFTTRGVALVRGAHELVLHPALLLLVISLTIAVGAFHELGHATAARYGGAKPGVMGVGIYLMLPAFYTDVSDSYRLDRRGRLRTDLGGVYFNAIAILVATGAFLLTGAGALLVFIVVSEIEVLYQFLPFVRMDGYYVVADLIGVPNLFAFVAPVFASLIGREHPSRQRLKALTRRTRVAIRTWVLLTVPILAFDALMFAWIAPHFFPGLWHSAQLFEKSAAFNIGRGDYVAALDNGFQLLFLAIPAVGFALMAGMLGGRLLRRVGAPVVRPMRDHPRWAFATLTVGAALLIAFIVPGGKIGEPEVPTTSAAAPRPAFQAPPPAMAIVNGHGHPANVFAVAVVGSPPTGTTLPSPAATPMTATPGTPVVTPAGTSVVGTVVKAGTGGAPSIGAPVATAPSAAVVGAPGGTPSTSLPVPPLPVAVPLPPVASVGVSLSAPAPPVSVTVSTPVASVGTSVGTTPSVSAMVSTPVGSVGTSVSAPAPPVSATVSTPVASVGTSVSAPAPSVSAMVSTPVGSVGTSVSAPAPSVSATVSTPVASVGTSVSAPAPSVTASVSTPVASVATSVTTTAPSVSPTKAFTATTTPSLATAPAPSVTASVSTPVASVATSVTTTAPSVSPTKAFTATTTPSLATAPAKVVAAPAVSTTSAAAPLAPAPVTTTAANPVVAVTQAAQSATSVLGVA